MEDGVKTVCAGRTGVDVPLIAVLGPMTAVVPSPVVTTETFVVLWYSMILKTFSGCLLEVMIVVTPAAVAISAAISLVSIPPVPRLEPSVVVLTE